MKQQITLEQVKELDIDAYRKWRDYMLTRYSEGGTLATIGQMIEFLDEQVPEFDLRGVRMTKSFLIDVPDDTMIWEIDGPWSTIKHETNLCDALWKAVKSVLENK